MKHMIPDVSDIDNIWDWIKCDSVYSFYVKLAVMKPDLGESRLTASGFNKGEYLDSFKLKVYWSCE